MATTVTDIHTVLTTTVGIIIPGLTITTATKILTGMIVMDVVITTAMTVIIEALPGLTTTADNV